VSPFGAFNVKNALVETACCVTNYTVRSRVQVNYSLPQAATHVIYLHNYSDTADICYYIQIKATAVAFNASNINVFR
jgi:hypothetical protein